MRTIWFSVILQALVAAGATSALASDTQATETPAPGPSGGSDPVLIAVTDQEPAPIVQGCDPNLRRDPYRVLDARVTGDTLLLTVEYGGGCMKHTFTLCWSGAFLESNPVQVPLVLHHDAHGDRCLALVTRLLRFDLSSLKAEYRRSYRRPHGVINLRLNGRAPLRYTF
jgi:hypothetical protein